MTQPITSTARNRGKFSPALRYRQKETMTAPITCKVHGTAMVEREIEPGETSLLCAQCEAERMNFWDWMLGEKYRAQQVIPAQLNLIEEG